MAAGDTMYFLGFGAIIVGIMFNIYVLTIGGIIVTVGGVFLDIWTGGEI